MFIAVILIIFPFFIAIPSALGFVFARSIWILYRWFKPFPLRPHTRSGMALSIGLISILLVMSLYTWHWIGLGYADTSPINFHHGNQVVLEAWRRSIIPPPFQKSCYNAEEIVCQLAESYRLHLWDSQIYADDLPWLAGLIAGITSTITMRSTFRSMTQRANSAPIDSIP